MEYALLIYGNEEQWSSRTEAEEAANHERHAKFMRLLNERNAMRGGRELARSSNASTVRDAGTGPAVTDGPYAETAEQLGGFYIVEATDLDDALALARELPEEIIEVRPIAPRRD